MDINIIESLKELKTKIKEIKRIEKSLEDNSTFSALMIELKEFDLNKAKKRKEELENIIITFNVGEVLNEIITLLQYNKDNLNYDISKLQITDSNNNKLSVLEVYNQNFEPLITLQLNSKEINNLTDEEFENINEMNLNKFNSSILLKDLINKINSKFYFPKGVINKTIVNCINRNYKKNNIQK